MFEKSIFEKRQVNKLLISAGGLIFAPFIFAFIMGSNAEAATGRNTLPNGGIGLSLTGGADLGSVIGDNAVNIDIAEPVNSDNIQKVYEERGIDAGSDTQTYAGTETGTFSYSDYLDGLSEEEAENAVTNIAVANIRNYITVWSEPTEGSESLAKMYPNYVCNILDTVEDGEWYYVTSGEVTGYVKSIYFITGEEAKALADEIGKCFAVIDSSNLYIRQESDPDAEITAIATGGEELLVTDVAEGWIGVETVDGEGWINADYVSLSWHFDTAETRADEEARLAEEAEARRKAQEQAAAAAAILALWQQEESDRITGQTGGETEEGYTGDLNSYELGCQVAEYALQFVGNPYVYGGNSLTNGTDCSGFTSSVYAYFGVSLTRGSETQRGDGYAVNSIEDAQPGDIICYSGHVALYIGNGMIVHAANSRRGIVTDSYDIMTVLAIRRIF